MRSMYLQDWSGYYALLNGPIFTTLVKELWKFARISDDGNTIWSEIYRLPISITISFIKEVTKCASSGATIDHYQSRLSTVESFRILHDSSIPYEPNNPENLLPYAQAWFRFSLTNLCPRETARSTLSHDDKIFIFLLSYHFRINLHKTIFNHLKHSIEVSRTQIHHFIP